MPRVRAEGGALMAVHELKIWPQYFQPLIEGVKRFELRKADREYRVGDELLLREFVDGAGEYTGRSAECRITYILGGPMAIPGMCLMSIKLLSVENKNALGQGKKVI
jgi:hypothetical protein